MSSPGARGISIGSRQNIAPIGTPRAPIATDPQSVVIELIGVPQGKGRPRFARRPDFTVAYTPSKTRAYERALAQVAQLAMRGRERLHGPLIVRLWAYMAVPPSWSRKRRDAALAGTARPTGRPDWDNLAKVCDALNGIVWKDDSQVVEGYIAKQYSESPRLRIEVTSLDPPLLSGDSDDVRLERGSPRENPSISSITKGIR